MLPATIEQRRNQRHRTLKAGMISFHHQWASIDCVVRDWSETGAGLTIANQTGIPATFDQESRDVARQIQKDMMAR